MAKVRDIKVIQTELDEHLAARVWRELNPLPIELQRIEILKGKVPDQNKSLKRIVCRLVPMDPMGAAIIGKRCKRANGLVENAIYTEILPHLPVSTPHYHGMVEETDGKYCWLFLEDAGEPDGSPLDGKYREFIVQWLSMMHTSASQLVPSDFLPCKGPDHYLGRMQSAREAILENLTNLAHQSDELAVVEAILRQFDRLESRWDLVEDFCQGTPNTLVHGDFVAKNIRVRNGRTGVTILPFDWGEAGWGTPAVDVMRVDVTGYLSMVRGHWPWLDILAVQRLAVVGKIFRCIDAVHWELPKTSWLREPRKNMGIYLSWLDSALRAAGLTSPVGSKV